MENIHTDVGVYRAKYVMQLLCSMYASSSPCFYINDLVTSFNRFKMQNAN